MTTKDTTLRSGGSGMCVITSGGIVHVSCDVVPGIRKTGRRNQTEYKIQLMSAHWTCDDRYVVTVHSIAATTDVRGAKAGGKRRRVNEDAIEVTSGITNKTEDSTTRLTVWDSTTGNTHHVICDIGCITSAMSAVHPSNVDICVTGGDRGIVKVWDVVTGTLTASYTLTGTDQYTTDKYTIAALGNKVDVTDFNFAPDGSAIVVSDSHGRIHTFGDKTCSIYCSADSSEVKSKNIIALNPYFLDQSFCKVLYPCYHICLMHV